ncbi:hypothetical protein EV126DRAFT_489530, partial [Verticillium dahliae]
MSSTLPDEQDSLESTSPATPRKPPPAGNDEHDTATPKTPAAARAAATPRSAPAAARARALSNRKTMQEPPTLLADFLLGRPSPQRKAAERSRQRRQSLDAVKAEMRQSSVRKLQQPGGVRDRVKQWQKTNATAMVAGDPAATPSEPTEIASFPDEAESVNEDDRVRIKTRQKKKPAKPIVHNDAGATSANDDKSADRDPGSKRSRSKGPPKRVVSDTNWMAKKNKKNSPPRAKSPPKAKLASPSPGPMPLPKGFLLRPSVNPPVSKKIKDWAAKVELPASPPPSEHRRSKSRGATTDGEGGDISPEAHSRPPPLDDDGIRVRPLRTKILEDDGIRVKPLRTPVRDDGIRVKPTRDTPKQAAHLTSQCKPSPTRDDIVVMDEDESECIEVIEEPDSCPDTPTRKPSGERPRRVSRRRTPPKRRNDTIRDDQSWISTDDSAIRAGMDSDLGSSDLTSAAGAKSLADIPVGFSAFSELDLPSGKGKRPKAQHNPSFKAVPNVFKKVVTEGKKILHEAKEPPKPIVANKPPSIEKWLSKTVDPFVEDADGKGLKHVEKISISKEHLRDTATRRRSSGENRRRKSSPPPKTELTQLTEL